MENNQFSNIYIQTEGAWEKEDQCKFGYTGSKKNSLLKRLHDSHEQHSYQKKLLMAYKIQETVNYHLGFKEHDEIIKMFLYNPEFIKELEKDYHCEFEYGRRLNYFKIENGGGEEFIQSEGLPTLYNFIEQELKFLGLEVIKYTRDEINEINEKNRLKIESANDLKNKTRNIILEKYRAHIRKKDIEITTNKIILHKFQKEAVEKIVEYFNNNNKALLNWVCRLGKTIASIFLINKLKFSKILIGVPSTQLLYQWQQKLKRFCVYKIILIGDNNQKNIKSIDKNTIVITTYDSSYKLKPFKFDFIILDEAHHLAHIEDGNSETDGKYRAILEVKSIKHLSLTATMKISEVEKVNFKGNNIEEIFGKVIDVKTLGWAIENGFVCDYDICNPILDRNMVEKKLEELRIDVSEELLVSCLTMLEVLKNNKNTHIINYTNKMNNSKKCRNIIEILLETDDYAMLRDKITNNEIISDTTKNKQDNILNDYRKSKYGIIHCCYKLGEGFDESLIDTVCISENMFSNIRIVQSLLRPHTKNKNHPDKKALILLPMMADLEKDLEQSDKYKKLSDIIKIISVHDENVTEKVKIVKCCKIKPKPSPDFIPVRSIFSESIVLKMINRQLIGGNSYKKLRKIINELGGRTSNTYLEDDYREKAKIHNLLEVVEVENLLRKNGKTWFDLYDIDTSKYPNWIQFKTKYGALYNREKYIILQKDSVNLPKYDDLDLLYKRFGYNINFWNKPTGCSLEF